MLAVETKVENTSDTVTPGLGAWISFGWKEIAAPIRPFLKSVDGLLEEQVLAFEPEIVPYARYALTSQGKQLRPALVALSAGDPNQNRDDLVTMAVIIEMIHLATLVHDDVIDVAQVRRGQPTLAAKWGNTVSVLVGDCLLAQAMKLATDCLTLEVCRAVAAATKAVCSGEIRQTLARSNQDMTREEYFEILAMKTGALFALSCDMGAALGAVPAAHRAILRQFGTLLGTAYQIYDDCLDLFGSETVAGKSLGTDMANGKLTLPVLWALERATVEDHRALKEMINHWRHDSLPRLLEILRRYDVLTESRQSVCAHIEAGRQMLAKLPDSDSRFALMGLTAFFEKQTGTLGVVT